MFYDRRNFEAFQLSASAKFAVFAILAAGIACFPDRRSATGSEDFSARCGRNQSAHSIPPSR